MKMFISIVVLTIGLTAYAVKIDPTAPGRHNVSTITTKEGNAVGGASGYREFSVGNQKYRYNPDAQSFEKKGATNRQWIKDPSFCFDHQNIPECAQENARRRGEQEPAQQGETGSVADKRSNEEQPSYNL